MRRNLDTRVFLFVGSFGKRDTAAGIEPESSVSAAQFLMHGTVLIETAANQTGVPHLFAFPPRSPQFVCEMSILYSPIALSGS